MLLKKKTAETRPMAPGAEEVGVLGLNSRFKGSIRFRGTLRLDGEVFGDVLSEEGTGTMLVVNQQARVTGNIIADSVLVSGKVKGNVTATERVEIYRTGSLKGDVTTGDLMIQGGAEFQGQCHMKRPTPAQIAEDAAKEEKAAKKAGGKEAPNPA